MMHTVFKHISFQIISAIKRVILTSAVQYRPLRRLQSEAGVALVMVLILAAIALATMAGLIFMTTSGTQITGGQKRYKTSLEAGFGGADVTFEMITARDNPNIPGLVNFNLPAQAIGGPPDDCLTQKLNDATETWEAACENTLDIDPATASTYDLTFRLGTDPFYTVYSKIVDTTEGNSGSDQGLTSKGVVTSNSGEIMPMSVPYLYTIELDVRNTARASDRAKLSILYEY